VCVCVCVCVCVYVCMCVCVCVLMLLCASACVCRSLTITTPDLFLVGGFEEGTIMLNVSLVDGVTRQSVDSVTVCVEVIPRSTLLDTTSVVNGVKCHRHDAPSEVVADAYDTSHGERTPRPLPHRCRL
jgi:hypothetical protein